MEESLISQFSRQAGPHKAQLNQPMSLVGLVGSDQAAQLNQPMSHWAWWAVTRLGSSTDLWRDRLEQWLSTFFLMLCVAL